MRSKKSFWGEFREFIARGNVMDMAVGVIVGAAFKAIIDSLVNDILMPFVGIFVKTDSFSSLSVNLGGAVITYGNFISSIVNFLIMAFVVFMLVRTINRAYERLATHKKTQELEVAPAAGEPATVSESELLAEILSVLKARQ